MKKIIFTLCFLLISLHAVLAQEDESHEKIEAAKIAMLSNNLNLSTTQAQDFWPVYNQYQSRKSEIRKGFKKFREDMKKENNDDEIKAQLKKMIAMRQADVDLDKEYLDKFLKVITPKQVVLLHKTEREFTKMLLNKLKEEK